ncbi:MAG: hypothetical protein VB106_09960 [Clostridiaceae bacterium]|nr:hypothetical protein [Clostridiaceae bacterium]
MNIVNEQVKHILYGDGKVICQETDYLSVQFSEQYGIKKFLYPDAFEKFLKMYNHDIEMYVLDELHDKQARIEAEELRKQQEYEDTVKKLLEKPKLAVSKKKSPTKSKGIKTDG